MKQTTTLLPAHDLTILQRCRFLGEEIDRLQANIDLACSFPISMSEAAEQLDLMPIRGLHTHMERIQQQELRLEALKAEFEPLREKAQCITDRIKSSKFRRFCELYCIDGVDLCLAIEFCGSSKRRGFSYAAMIRNHTTD